MGSPCPTNLTGLPAQAGTLIQQSEITTCRTSLNDEFTRRSIAISSWTSMADPVAAQIWNELRGEIVSKLYTQTPPSPAPTLSYGAVSVGDLIAAAHIDDLVTKLDEWKVVCVCDCDFCPCNCNFCPCDCNFCPCDCNFCPCNCNHCPCNCNFCPCNCNFCPCNCNFCPCNCNFCPCNCNFCPCNCNFCPCDCNHCPCNCNNSK